MARFNLLSKAKQFFKRIFKPEPIIETKPQPKPETKPEPIEEQYTKPYEPYEPQETIPSYDYDEYDEEDYIAEQGEIVLQKIQSLIDNAATDGSVYFADKLQKLLDREVYNASPEQKTAALHGMAEAPTEALEAAETIVHPSDGTVSAEERQNGLTYLEFIIRSGEVPDMMTQREMDEAFQYDMDYGNPFLDSDEDANLPLD